MYDDKLLKEYIIIQYTMIYESSRRAKRKWVKDNPEKRKEALTKYNASEAGYRTRWFYRMRKLYGINNIDEEVYERYKNTTHCDVCNSQFKSNMYKCVDHDHTTGKFRWILCRACNTSDAWKKYFN